MSTKKAWFIVIISVALLGLFNYTPIGNLGLVIEGPLQVITLILMIKYRKPIADWFRKIPLPTFLVALIST